jgi:hypothetical protein
MHDFIRHLSFNSTAPFVAARSAAEPMRCLVRSFNEDSLPFTAYRPVPRAAANRPKRPAPANRKS